MHMFVDRVPQHHPSDFPLEVFDASASRRFLAPQARQLDAAHQRAQELDAALKEAQVQMVPW